MYKRRGRPAVGRAHDRRDYRAATHHPFGILIQQ